ncbi:DNA cytosine methyltransferase [Qipengyuania gaetbuli]|uniref:DNA cytosine methyltransferase n=1 Tax=Qipengyuania gaetbuli TaxID=266952 RepID=UPI001CD3CCD6|nr:DNA cytosine methyltransferase [Qipengyuania gaetbuli]MCA0910076.1 DNA cytosine methyltransferase [Qipengyuania gaetbuli]
MISQSFERKNRRLYRKLEIGGRASQTEVADLGDPGLSPSEAWWQSKLREAVREELSPPRSLKVVDAFSGSGGLSLGANMAIQAAGFGARHVAAIDTDAAALAVHRHNFETEVTIADSASRIVDYHVLGQDDDAEFGYDPELISSYLLPEKTTDLFLAGPPCQGHSNLNNHTRRDDPRNQLYITSVALGLALKASCIVIENVPTVLRDKSNVVGTGETLLRAAGYSVASMVLRADDFGAPQTRARFFLIATKAGDAQAALEAVANELQSPAMPLSWAISDLLDKSADGLMNTPAAPSPVTLERINYLFDNKLHDLPNDQRPDCHKNGHSYPSVYGRMHWDKPAQTITTGFNAAGQGRYVHPKRRRVITPREAARIQGFPDWFNFMPEGIDVRRKDVAKWIGDAVHPILGYAAVLSALTALEMADATSREEVSFA